MVGTIASGWFTDRMDSRTLLGVFDFIGHALRRARFQRQVFQLLAEPLAGQVTLRTA